MFNFYILSNKIRIDIACSCQCLLKLYIVSRASLGHWRMHTPSCRQAYSVCIWASYFSSFQHLVLIVSRMPALLRWAVTRGEGHLSGNTWEVTIVEWMKDDPACWGHSCATGPSAQQPALWAQPLEFKPVYWLMATVYAVVSMTHLLAMCLNRGKDKRPKFWIR